MNNKAYFKTTGVLLALLLAIIGIAVQPAAASCGGTTVVSDETELNAAIAAFNAVAAGPCTFTIELSGDIALTASTTAIQNPDNTGNLRLVIEGAGYTVNGQNKSGVRPFTLHASNLSPVTINQITITGGYVPGGSGGGIEIVNGHLTVTNSTITGNRADAGGGISVGSLIYSELTLLNSTVSGNRADTGYGGGILVSGPATIENSTIVDNQAVSGGGGALGATGSNAAATVTNSILANSTTPGGGSSVADCAVSAGAGTVTDGGYNLVETAGTCNFVNGTNNTIVGQDPMLGPLADNGGPTWTHFPQKNSPILDAGSCAAGTDQRGETRPVDLKTSGLYPNVDNGCDIGAVEAQSETPTAIHLANLSAGARKNGTFLLVAGGLLMAAIAAGGLLWQKRQKTH